jgi:hypothetical protein
VSVSVKLQRLEFSAHVNVFDFTCFVMKLSRKLYKEWLYVVDALLHAHKPYCKDTKLCANTHIHKSGKHITGVNCYFQYILVCNYGLWVVTPCGLTGRYKRFGGIYCLHLQGRLYVLKMEKNISSTLKMEEVISSSETLVPPMRLHGVITQKPINLKYWHFPSDSYNTDTHL